MYNCKLKINHAYHDISSLNKIHMVANSKNIEGYRHEYWSLYVFLYIHVYEMCIRYAKNI